MSPTTLLPVSNRFISPFSERARLSAATAEYLKKIGVTDIRLALVVKEHVKVCTSAMEACTGAEGICVLTEWDEFKSLDWEAIYESMAKPAMVFDGRGILDADKLRSIGFKVFSIGKGVNL